MAKIIPPVRSEPFFDELNTPTIRYFEFWEGTANTSNDQSDQIDFIVAVIAVIIERLDAIDERLDLIEDRLDAIESRLDYQEGLIIVTATNVTLDNTVTGIQTIICTADLTVTYYASPNDKDKVTVVSNGFEVTLNPNTKTINGDSEVILRRGFKIGLDTIYSSEQDEYFEV